MGSATFGRFWLPVQYVDRVVVRRVLLGGVGADDPAVGWMVAQREF